MLCPPLGDEDRRVYRTFRKLAESLAAAGHLALRFSYDGTGDSVGSLDDPDRVAAWVASIAEAVGVVRSCGAPKTAVVGMRLGATLATHAAGSIERPLDAVVLWDPCVSGREFLRHQQILLATLPETTRSGRPGVETPGFHFPPAVSEELRRLTIQPIASAGTRTLVLARPDRPAPARLREGMGAAAFDEREAVGQDELLDVPPLDATVPRQSIGQITDWLSDVAGNASAAVGVPRRDEAVVGVDRHGRPIRERAVRLGELGLFAIATVPDDGGAGPWMLFVNVATEHHIGPGRLWVDLARDWARQGIRSLRFDLSGIGDSPVRPGQRENRTYAREWLDDLPALAAAISPGDPSDTVFIGLCSGGYSAFEAGLAVGSRGAYVFNPALSSASMNKSTEEADPRRRAFRPLPVPLARLARKHGRTAWWIWRAYRQVAVGQAPMSVPASAVAAGLDVLLVCGEADAGPLREVAYWRFVGERRMRRTGRFEMTVVPAMDHVLLFDEGRRAGARRLTEHVLARFGAARAGEEEGARRPPGTEVEPGREAESRISLSGGRAR